MKINKLKIGLITILKVNNYGAELQAFAFQKKLSLMGFDVETIDYLFYKHKDFHYTKQAKPFVKIGIKRRLKEFLNPILTGIQSFPYRHIKKQRDEKFKNFHQKYTKFSKQTFHSIDKLYQADFDYDIFIVGSDQVWNPQNNVTQKPYFLTFAPDTKRKISYASSFGVSSIPLDAQSMYKEWLNNLDDIMVREEQGVRIVKEITGRNAKHVLDPTLLLDIKEWGDVAICLDCKEPYLLLYVLTDSEYITQFAKKMANELNLNLVRICKNSVKQDQDNTIQNIIDAGPSEYIGLFLNASFVLTNSFHGTAFSLNFEKPFYTVLSKNKSNNSRQEGLLSLMHLEDRLIYEGEDFPQQETYFPDLSDAMCSLKEKREQSVSLLLNSING